MRGFKNILFAYDGMSGREEAFDKAVSLARKHSSSLKVVWVLKNFSFGTELLIEAQGLEELERIDTNENEEMLKKFVSMGRRKGVQISAQVLRGIPFIEIIREVLRDNHDLVVVSREVKSPFSDMFYGSTTFRLIRKCPCPVLAYRSNDNGQVRRVLVAVDFAPLDENLNDLNIKMTRLAASLAHKEGSELHIVHCWNERQEKRLKKRLRLKSNDTENFIREIKKAHKRALAELVEKCTEDYFSPQVHLLEGEPEEVIVGLTKTEKVGLLVMGTISRVGIAGFFIGNTAEKILNQVECSVLTVKPDGFRTPVTLD
jgi:nucleotide-binding universal stress UspA family protein